MRKSLVAVVISLIFVSVMPAFSASITGTKCTKAGTTKTVSNMKYTCVKQGSKLIWNKGVAIKQAVKATPAPVPTPTPSETPKSEPKPAVTTTPTPTSTPTYEPKFVDLNFSNLYENRLDISYTAWKKASNIATASKSKAGTISVYTGPNTKPFFDDYSYAVGQVSKLFPAKSEPIDILVIRYIYEDMDWAENIAKTKLSESDYAQLRINENGPVTKGNCDSQMKACRGSRQQTVPSGTSVILQGVELTVTQYPQNGLSFYNGMLEAHEYFHSLQRIPIMNTGVRVWPHAWWREGGATWVQNAAINVGNYAKYKSYIDIDCKYHCKDLTQADYEDFLLNAFDNTVPAKFSPDMNYTFGSLVIESLVAIKGPEVLIDMYAEMGKGLTFNAAFKNLFGIEWANAIPTLAKVIKANQS